MTEAKKTTTRVKRDHSHASDPIDAAYQLSRRYNITELAKLMTVTSVVGAVFGELHLARQDGVIDPIERQAITAAVHRAIRELLSLEESVASQVRPLPVAVQGGAK